MLLKEPVGMKFALGENPKSCYRDKDQPPTTRMAIASLIRETLSKAKRYMDDTEDAKQDDELDPPDFDAKLEALIPVLQRKIKAFFHCHRTDDIFTALRITKEFNLDTVLIHCTEGHLIADELLEANAKIICGPLICTRSKPELKNHTTKTPAILSAKGLNVAICTDYNVVPIEYLAISGGIAVREGMTYSAALRAITINAAEICGISDRVGSIEIGKDADFVLYKGNPLSLSEKPVMVFING
ncbi:MAG: amidohydrolase family protein, partial [Oscillospiraceae bacterium]